MARVRQANHLQLRYRENNLKQQRKDALRIRKEHTHTHATKSGGTAAAAATATNGKKASLFFSVISKLSSLAQFLSLSLLKPSSNCAWIFCTSSLLFTRLASGDVSLRVLKAHCETTKNEWISMKGNAIHKSMQHAIYLIVLMY